MEKIFFITQDFNNTRLDRWFKKNVSDVPQSFIEKNIRKGNIKVNKKRSKSSHKLQYNDKVTIFDLKIIPNKNKKKTNKYIPTKKEISQQSNFFVEDNENFVVINKPSGIAVQSGTKSRKNILDILSKSKEFNNTQPYAVHRIDKETSGIFLVAKNRKYAQLFTSLFRIRKIHKTYLGIVLGELQQKSGTLTDVLIHFEGRKKILTKAITHYKVIDSNKNYSLLRLNSETGRKHQLRKQLLIHGHPILGDSKYRIKDTDKNKRHFLMLHSYKINFSIQGSKYNFIAEPPLTFIKFLKEKYLRIF